MTSPGATDSTAEPAPDCIDVTTLTRHEMLDVMRASGGYIVVNLAFVGASVQYRHNPVTDRFEELVTFNDPSPVEDGGVRVDLGIKSHTHMGEATAFDRLKPAETMTHRVEVLAYPASAFNAAAVGFPEAFDAGRERANRSRSTTQSAVDVRVTLDQFA